MYTVIGALRSRAFRVLWTLEEMGLAYDHVASGPHSPDTLAHNPSGKIPALKVGDDVLTDSVAIMSYLADKHGMLTHPAGTIARARQDALIHRLNEELDATLWMAARHTAILPEEHRVPAIIPSLHWEFARHIDRLAESMEGPFLMGETMTIADILASHCLNWAMGAKFPVENPRIRDFAREMRNRAAFTKLMAA